MCLVIKIAGFIISVKAVGEEGRKGETNHQKKNKKTP